MIFKLLLNIDFSFHKKKNGQRDYILVIIYFIGLCCCARYEIQWLTYILKGLCKNSRIWFKPGYQRKLTNRIPIDLGMGLGYNVFRDVTHKIGIEIINESTHYLNFTGGLSIGYIF